MSEKRNPAYGCWSEEETNWSPKDTAFIDATLQKKNKRIPISYKEIVEKHKSLEY